MRLHEILTENLNPQMSFQNLGLSMRDLGIMLKDVNKDLATAIDHEDYGQLLPATSKVGRWFKENYQGRIQPALYALSKQKAFSFLQDDLKQILITANKDKTKDMTSSTKDKFRTAFKQILHILNMVEDVYQKAKSTPYKDFASRQDFNSLMTTRTAFLTVQEKLKTLSEMAKDSKQDDPNAAADKEKEKQSKQMGGQQRDQASQMASQVIATLPQEHQHEIRQIVNKADNKLQALQQAMKQRGLTEGIKRLKRMLNETRRVN